jgi:tetratricopeptide (TPR) repeat protein
MKGLLVALLLFSPSWAGAGRDIKNGEKAVAAGQLDAALRSFEKALDADPDNKSVLLRIARVQILLGNPESALAPSRVASAAGEPGADMVLARALLETAAFHEAVAIALRAKESGTSPELALVLGEAYLSQGKFQQAIEELAVATEAGLLRGHVAWAYALARSGKANQARIEASSLQLRHSEDPMALAGVTVIFNLIGDLPAAQAASEQAQLAANDHSSTQKLAQSWLDRANRRHARGDIEGALWIGLPAMALTPKDGHLAWVLGTWWLQSKQYLHAATYLSRALTTAPYASAAKRLGVVVMSSDAMDATKKSAARKQIALSLALCHEHLGDANAEAAALQMAIDSSSDPDSVVLLRLSKAYESAGEYTDSAKAAIAAAKADDNNSEAHLRVAQGYAAAGKADVAIRYAMQAWQTDNGSVDTALLLAELFLARREPRQAMDVLNIALDTHPKRADLAELRDQILAQSAYPY